jgi:hypothetical protein
MEPQCGKSTGLPRFEGAYPHLSVHDDAPLSGYRDGPYFLSASQLPSAKTNRVGFFNGSI